MYILGGRAARRGASVFVFFFWEGGGLMWMMRRFLGLFVLGGFVWGSTHLWVGVGVGEGKGGG